MSRGIPFAAVASLLAASSFVVHTTVAAQSKSADVQVELGHQLMVEGRYPEAIQAFQVALAAAPTSPREARAGIVQAAIRVALFDQARKQADLLLEALPDDPFALTLSGDALWAAGMFDEAEARYQRVVASDPRQARARHGMARSLASRGRLDEALAEAERALALLPSDGEMHHTIGTIYEKKHLFRQAADAYSRFVRLLPKRDRTDRARWTRSQITFLRAFEGREAFRMEKDARTKAYTVDFRIVNEKIIVRARVNDGALQDFVVDTGAELTVLSRPVAQRSGVRPLTTTISSGVGEFGFRSLQLARIDTLEIGSLKVRNVPTIIKSPALRDLPIQEGESLSPLALGMSMIIDYENKQLTFGRDLPVEPSDFELPLRLHRLAVVRGTVDHQHPANFVVDTGGQVISISQATVARIGRPEPDRRVQLRVFGSSGWDRDAFLMPGVDLAFDTIRYPRHSVVVLNLSAPSALLGFQLGGTVGHSFLSRYRVAIDLERSVLRLRRTI